MQLQFLECVCTLAAFLDEGSRHVQKKLGHFLRGPASSAGKR